MSRSWSEWPRPFAWEPERTALCVIDMQRGFIKEGAPLEVPMAREQLPTCAELLAVFRARSLTVVFTRFVVGEDFVIPFYRARAPDRGLHLPDFEPGGYFADIAPELKPRPEEPVIDKCGYDGFADTRLDGMLRGLGIDTIVLVGTVVNWCVDSTLRGAFHRRYQSIVVADAVSGYDHAGRTGAEWVEAELEFFAEALALVLPSGEFVAALDDPARRRAGPST